MAALNLTKVDRLAFSARCSEALLYGTLKDVFSRVGKVSMASWGRGAHGFTNAASLTVDGALAATLCWGGQQQRGKSYADVSGLGCQLLGDVAPLVEVASTVKDSNIRRVDIAADFYDGSISHESVQAAYWSGGFLRSGRPPKMTKIESADPSDGKTVYIGVRGNDQLLRGYEKGLKEVKDLDLGDPESVTFQIDGKVVDPRNWYRLELELRAKTRPIPWETVCLRDQYFTGAYPYLQTVYPDISPELLITPQKAGELTLNKALSHIQRQYGNTLYTALVAADGDIGAVWDRIVGKQLSERLVASGALLGGHDD